MPLLFITSKKLLCLSSLNQKILKWHFGKQLRYRTLSKKQIGIKTNSLISAQIPHQTLYTLKKTVFTLIWATTILLTFKCLLHSNLYTYYIMQLSYALHYILPQALNLNSYSGWTMHIITIVLNKQTIINLQTQNLI